jgi:hypothetical protein
MHTMLDQRGAGWAARQTAYQALMLLLSLRTIAGCKRFPLALVGKAAGLAAVFRHRRQWQGYTSRA